MRMDQTDLNMNVVYSYNYNMITVMVDHDFACFIDLFYNIFNFVNHLQLTSKQFRFD